ncbi:RNA polymerase sigma factor RpoE [Planctomycetales bacterium 10988]|nr:RNA polymerase sigma factor RpoE [Planctomycetales bacterium 10988]
MGLTEIDRNLLLRCLGRKEGAWEDFVDRFLGLVVHVVNHTSSSRSITLSQEDVDDLCAEIFLAFVQNDFAVLRHFRGQSSLATYLTVVARRVCVKELLRRSTAGVPATGPEPTSSENHEERISNREEVARLVQTLNGPEREVVRLYHLEQKSYSEIAQELGIPENSIGPTLSRAREKMRSLDPAS